MPFRSRRLATRLLELHALEVRAARGLQLLEALDHHRVGGPALAGAAPVVRDLHGQRDAEVLVGDAVRALVAEVRDADMGVVDLGDADLLAGRDVAVDDVGELGLEREDVADRLLALVGEVRHGRLEGGDLRVRRVLGEALLPAAARLLGLLGGRAAGDEGTDDRAEGGAVRVRDGGLLRAGHARLLLRPKSDVLHRGSRRVFARGNTLRAP